MALEKPETLAFFGGRKYVLVWAGLIVATVALAFGKAPFLEWSGFVLADFGFYFKVNYEQKKTEGEQELSQDRIKALARGPE